ncbi:MAG: hypothetical protein QM705_06765 [Ancrocorticia sp.]
MQIVAGLGVYWRTRDVLQIGLDPRVGVLIEGLSRSEQEIVTFLTKSRTAAEINAMAGLKGISEERIAAILALLHRSGVLEGLVLPAPTSTHAALTQGHSLPTVRTNSGSPSREHHHVHITRLDPLGTEIGLRLAQLGVGTVSFSDPAPVQSSDHPMLWPNWHGAAREQAMTTVLRQFSSTTSTMSEEPPGVVVFTGAHFIHPYVTRLCMDEDIPHLLAWEEEIDVCVGPLVEPHSSSCAACMFHNRMSVDPAWNILAAQAQAGVSLATTGESRALAASIAVRSILGFLDGLGNSLRNTQWRVPPTPLFPRAIEAASNRECGCSSHEAMLTALESALPDPETAR